MSFALRKFSISDSLLEEIGIIIKRTNPDPMSLSHEERHETPVSIDFCRAFKKPKKVWNAFIKLGIYNLQYNELKPGYHSYTCKIYNGKIITLDIKKESWISYKKALEEALQKFYDMILTIKINELAEQKKKDDERRELLREKLGKDVDLTIPDNVELDDELVNTIGEVLDTIKQPELS